jgi:Fis family transcriptional regulator
MSTVESQSIQEAVLEFVESYFRGLNGDVPAGDIYQIVLEQVERPMLSEVLKQAGHNQCRATQYLGLARGTVLKKLKQYGLINPRPRRRLVEEM